MDATVRNFERNRTQTAMLPLCVGVHFYRRMKQINRNDARVSFERERERGGGATGFRDISGKCACVPNCQADGIRRANGWWLLRLYRISPVGVFGLSLQIKISHRSAAFSRTFLQELCTKYSQINDGRIGMAVRFNGRENAAGFDWFHRKSRVWRHGFVWSSLTSRLNTARPSFNKVHIFKKMFQDVDFGIDFSKSDGQRAADVYKRYCT